MWVAAIQLNSTPEMAANLARARALIEAAAQRGAQLAALPEYFACCGGERAVAAAAQSLDGPRAAARFLEWPDPTLLHR